MQILNLSHISKFYDYHKEQKAAVNDLSLNIQKGEIYGFLGPNGAGKTTTIKLILGLIKPDKGKIKLFGRSGDQIVKSKIGYMSEQPYFYYYLTAYEILDFAANLFNISKDKKHKKIMELLSLVGLRDNANLSVKNFSKGMNQRLGLASALINEPQLILLDEPLDGLDPIGRLAIKNILLKEKARGTTIFFNSHILADAEEICDRIGIINNGILIEENNPKILAKKEKTLEKYFVKLINKNNEK